MLEVSRGIALGLSQLSETSYPNEACGVLLGHLAGEQKRATFLFPLRNTAAEAWHRFFVPAEAMLDAERLALSRGEDVVGIFHTHPDVPATPSEYDRTHALPVYSYLIGSVHRGDIGELKSYVLDLDTFQFVEENVSYI